MSKYSGDICQGTDANRYFAKFKLLNFLYFTLLYFTVYIITKYDTVVNMYSIGQLN
jgi:hypothetical protein